MGKNAVSPSCFLMSPQYNNTFLLNAIFNTLLNIFVETQLPAPDAYLARTEKFGR